MLVPDETTLTIIPENMSVAQNEIVDKFLLSYTKPNGLSGSLRRNDMPMVDATLISALAALITSIAGLILSLRRKV